MNTFKSITEIGAEATERKAPPMAADKTSPTQQTFFEPEKKEEKKIAATPAIDAPAAPVMKMDKERAKKSGMVAAYNVAGGLEFLFGAVETVRHHFSMPKVDKIKLVAIKRKKFEQWTEEEKKLNEEFQMLSEKHAERKAKIPSTERQMQVLEHGFSLHAEVTGKEMGPNAIIAGACLRYVGERILDMI